MLIYYFVARGQLGLESLESLGTRFPEFVIFVDQVNVCERGPTFCVQVQKGLDCGASVPGGFAVNSEYVLVSLLCYVIASATMIGIPEPVKGPLDISRAEKELGYVPKFDLHAGVNDYIRTMKCQLNAQ